MTSGGGIQRKRNTNAAQGRPKQVQPPWGWSLRLQACLCRFGQTTEAKRPASRGLQGLESHTKWANVGAP